VSEPTPRAPVPRWRRVLSWILLIGGFVLLAYLVYEAGPARVWGALVDAGPYLPLILLADFGWFFGEVVAHRVLLEDDAPKMPLGELVRANLAAFAFVVLAPLGKAGAEVARAVAVARRVGGPRAVAAAANVQSASLLGNAIVSVPCALAVFGILGVESILGWLVVGNAVVTLSIGSFTLVLARRGRLGERLAERFDALSVSGPETDLALRVRRGTFAKAVAATAAARVSQTVQYGVLLLAVGGTLTVSSALATQGVHLVGAGLGDFVPGQVGVVEGAYRMFASALDLAPARSLSIGLLARTSSLILAASSLLGLLLWRRTS